MHLQIKPGLRTAWRAVDCVQIGLDPDRGALLEGLTTTDRALVHQLADGLDEGALPGGGPAGRRARELLGLLRSRDVLVSTRAGRATLARVGPGVGGLVPDAAVWGIVHADGSDGWELLAARRLRRVHVAGDGRLATTLVETLAAAGVGRLTTSADRTPADGTPADGTPADGTPATGTPATGSRASGNRASGVPAARAPRAAPGAAADADLVVLVRAAAADSLAAARLLAEDVPHLSVVVREAGLVIGPLVLPGAGPCLRCLDLHRTDRDPGWPRVLAQLPGRATPADAGETASSRLGAGLAALQVLTHLDGRGRPAAVGATLEVDLPDGLVSRRPWAVHPACGCAGALGPGSRERSGARPGRMVP